MSLDSILYTTSNINAILGSVVGYTQENTGSYLGYAINSAAGYGSSEANAKGTSALIGASLLTSPFGIFGMMNPYSTLYGCGPYGNGFWNSGFFGRGCGCNTPFMFGGPTMFGMNGFWC